MGNAIGAGMSGSYSVRHTNETWGRRSAIEPVKGIIDDGTRDLTGAIGAEIEEHDGIPIDDTAIVKRHGLDELIGDARHRRTLA